MQLTLHEHRAPAVDDTPRPPSVAMCFLTLSYVWVALRLIGLQRTLKGLRRFERSDHIRNSVTTEAILATVLRNSAIAGAWYPGRARCLERSVTLAFLLRRQGIDAKLRIGVRQYRPGAHAWVEFQGRPINESAEEIRKVTLLPDIPL